MPLMEISIVPVGTDASSFSSVIREVCRVIDQHGLPYQVTPTATVIEGNIDQLMNVAAEIHRTPLNHGADRVVTQITIDDRSSSGSADGSPFAGGQSSTFPYPVNPIAEPPPEGRGAKKHPRPLSPLKMPPLHLPLQIAC